MKMPRKPCSECGQDAHKKPLSSCPEKHRIAYAAALRLTARYLKLKYATSQAYRIYVKQKSALREFRKAGLTISEFRKLARKGCAICGTLTSFKGTRLRIDHNPRTEKIRGVLCNAHNTALGLFGDNPILLRKAADYIERN